MAVDADGLLARHQQGWVQRVEVLERWHEARARMEQAGNALERRRRALEAELVRVSQGLTARQRTWAAKHSAYESRPRARAGRELVVRWTYRRKQIEAAETKWAAAVAAARQKLVEAGVSLAAASHDVLDAWAAQAPGLTGMSRPELRLLARRVPISSPSSLD